MTVNGFYKTSLSTKIKTLRHGVLFKTILEDLKLLLCIISMCYDVVVRYDDDGNLITQDDRVTISEGFLSLSSTQKSDEGAITCVAANSVGNSTTSTDLRVLGMPRPI